MLRPSEQERMRREYTPPREVPAERAGQSAVDLEPDGLATFVAEMQALLGEERPGDDTVLLAQPLFGEQSHRVGVQIVTRRPSGALVGYHISRYRLGKRMAHREEVKPRAHE